ncbi:beta strand repeat-containing protein [Patescibacteria group bacterium]
MKKFLFYISIPIILLAGWLAIPLVQAQDIVDIALTADVDTGCQWSGTPWASNLTVPDGDICHVYGPGRTAVSVNVAADAGLGGGRLIVGTDGDDTDFTASGTITIGGTAEIGYPGNPVNYAYMATQAASGQDLIINGGGKVTITSNTNEDNYLAIDDHIFVGQSGSAGTLENYDDSVAGSSDFMTIYGTFNNYDGKMTVDTTLWMYDTGHLNNDASFEVSAQIQMRDTSTIDTSGGTFTAGIVYIGVDSGDTASITNSGTFNIFGGTDYLNVARDTTFNNTGTLEVSNYITLNDTGTLTNSSTGSVMADILYMYDESTFNNNDTADVDVAQTTYVYSQVGTGPNYTDRSTLDNNSIFTTDTLYLGTLGSVYGGIVNNSGTLNVNSVSASATRAYEGGKITNETGGVFDPAGGILINGSNTTSALSSVNNDSTAANAFIVEGTISFGAYSLLTNSGDLTANNTTPISIGANNADIVNTGDFIASGTVTLGFDVLLDNGSTATFTIVGSSYDLSMGASASIENAGAFVVPDDMLMSSSSSVTNDDTGAAATFNLTGTGSYLYVYDTASITNQTGATFDVTGSVSTYVYLYGAGTQVDNYGTFNANRMYLGDVGTYAGGTFNNQSGGDLNITYTGTSALVIYGGGYLYNDAAATDLDVAGGFYLDNNLNTDISEIDSSGPAHIGGNSYIYEYGFLDLNGGTWDAENRTTYIYATATDKGAIDVASGAILAGAAGLYAGSTGTYGGDIIIQSGGLIARDGTTPSTTSTTMYLYNGASITNDGTLDLYAGTMSMYNYDIGGTGITISNSTTGDIITGYLNIWHANHVFNNLGDVDIRTTFNNGSTSNDGGTFNNGSAVVDTATLDLVTATSDIVMYRGAAINNYGTLTTGDDIDINRDSTFTNKADGIVNTGDSIAVGENGSYSEGQYLQEEGSDGQAAVTKTTVGGAMSVMDNGRITIYDKTYITSNLQTNSSAVGGIFETNNGTSAVVLPTIGVGNQTLVYTDATKLIDSSITLTSQATLTVNSVFSLYGTLTNDGSLVMVDTGSNNFRVTGGTVNSSSTSSFHFPGNIGMVIIDNAGDAFPGWVELAGTVTGRNIENEFGYLCIGEYTGTYPSGSCGTSGGSVVLDANFDADPNSTNDTSYTDVANDMEVQGPMNISSNTGSQTTTFTHTDGLLEVTNNSDVFIYDAGTTFSSSDLMNIQDTGENNSGEMNVQDGATVSLTGTTYNIGSIFMADASTLDLGTTTTGATLNLVDYHPCNYGAESCALELGGGAFNGPTTFNGYGDIVISDLASVDSAVKIGGNLGYTGGVLNLLANANVHGTLLNNSPGVFDVDAGGTLDMDYFNGTHYGQVDVDGNPSTTGDGGEAHIDGIANIDGTFRCDTLFWAEDDGNVDVGITGKVYVTGSSTVVDSAMELDGLLDSGTGEGDSVTVSATGSISSGAGSSTAFEILTHDLTIASGGRIASDGVSTTAAGTAGSGSYGGEGEGRSGGGITYGDAKLDENDAPVYGEGGSDGALDANGGGGARVYATGSISLTGDGTNTTISADGADSATSGGGAGAGGTVIIVQDPLTDNETFTSNATAIISASGGDGSGGADAGGGGRIVITSPLLDDPDDDNSSAPHYQYTGSIKASGGTGASYGAAGTIVYLGDANNDDSGSTVYGTLIVDQEGNATTGGEETEIPNSGNIEFARVEARDAADISYATNPTTAPISCYDNDNGSTVSGPTCAANPDKPDTLYVNDSIDEAQTGAEPFVGTPISGLYDLTPSFSAIYRNPEDTASSVDQVIIQVDNEPTFSVPLLWDTSSTPVTLDTAVTDGQRTEGIEYAGTALSASTTYYVRMAFEDTTDTNQGLWSHVDIGSHYNFDIDGSMTITDGCSSTLNIYDDYPDGDGGSVRDVDDDRYGNGECAITVNSTYGYWSVLFGKQSGETVFDDATTAYNIDPIDNAGADCSIHTHGTGTEEEYGFNFSSASTVINNHVETDAECSAAYNSWSQTGADDSNVFDVEDSGSEDEIIRVDDNNTATGEVFTLNMHSHVNSSTEVTDYALGVSAIITTNP